MLRRTRPVAEMPCDRVGAAATVGRRMREMAAGGLAALLASIPVAASAGVVAGIQVPERTEIGESLLVLNGAGLRKRAFFKVYVAALYLAEKRTSPGSVLALRGPKRMTVTLMRSVSVRELVDGLTAGIRANSSADEQRAIRGRVDQLAANLLSVESARQGDVITFDWRPESGTRVRLNGRAAGPDIAGEDLYKALLKVWLGERPTSASLKQALLGRVD